MDRRTPPLIRMTRRPLVVGVIGALLFFAVAAIWTLATPRQSAPDELAQTVKAASVAQGELSGPERHTTIDAPPYVDSIESSFRIPAGYADLYLLNACYVTQPQVPAGCAPAPSPASGTAVATSYVGTYPPTYYALVGWPTRFFDPGLGLRVMRLASCAVAAALAGLALTAARRTDGGGLVVAGLLVGLPPMAIYMASVVNPSGMEILGALALWTGALALVRPAGRVTRGDVVRAAVAFCAMAASRTLSPLLAVGIVVAVVLMAARREDLARLRRAPAATVAGVVVLGWLALSGLYLLWSKAYASAAGAPVPGLDLQGALSGSLSRLGYRARQAVGYFGYMEVAPPWSLLGAWSAMGGGLLVAAVVAGPWRRRLVLGLLLLGTVVFTTVPEAVNAARIGYVWQGRYSLPVAVGIPILSAWAVGRARWWRPRLLAPCLALVAVLWVLGQSIAVCAVLRRYVAGNQGGFFSFLDADGWHPTFSPGVLALGGLLATAAFAAWAVLVARGEGRPSADAELAQAPTTRPTSAVSRPANASRP